MSVIHAHHQPSGGAHHPTPDVHPRHGRPTGGTDPAQDVPGRRGELAGNPRDSGAIIDALLDAEFHDTGSGAVVSLRLNGCAGVSLCRKIGFGHDAPWQRIREATDDDLRRLGLAFESRGNQVELQQWNGDPAQPYSYDVDCALDAKADRLCNQILLFMNWVDGRRGPDGISLDAFLKVRRRINEALAGLHPGNLSRVPLVMKGN